MSGWLRHHAQSFAAALARIAGEPLGAALNTLVIGVALALPLAAFTALTSLGALVPAGSAEPEMSVFLDLDATRADVERLRAELAGLPGIRNVRFVPKDEALAEIAKTEGLGEVATSLKRNPLPDAFVVRLASPAAAEHAAERAGRLQKVARAQLDAAWVKRLQALLALARAAIVVVGALLAVGLVAATFNTIRLQLATRREEIEVSRLVGATEAWIRRRFLYFGAVQGALGAVAAAALDGAAGLFLGPLAAELSGLYGGQGGLTGLDAPTVAGVVALGAGLGWTGAFLSVSRHLHTLR
ncbi:MAG: permease-like cell division protein FtsX [Burkholderiales bacterium]|nr:permease-like cell division protein FtsX [Burkholderiales bacterium]